MVGRIYHVGLTVSDWNAQLHSTEMSLGLSFKERFLWKAKKQIKCFVE